MGDTVELRGTDGDMPAQVHVYAAADCHCELGITVAEASALILKL